MLYQFTLLSIVLFFSLGMSIDLTVEENVTIFKNKFKEKTVNGHRSGKMNDENKTNYAETWRNSTHCEYEVHYSALPEEIENDLNTFLKDNGLNYTIGNQTEGEIIYEKIQNPQEKNAVLLKEMREGGTLPVKDLLNISNKLVNKFKMLNKEVEYELYKMNNANDSLYSLLVRYRRVFNGGIILNNVSYVCIELSSQGEVLSFEIKWPKFIAIEDNLKGNNYAISLDEAEQTASSILADPPSAEIKNKVVNPLSAHIKGVACAWMVVPKSVSLLPVEIITPCFSFASSITFDSGDKKAKYLQVPRLSKYH